MKLPKLLSAYWCGWKNLLASCILAWVWSLIVFVPPSLVAKLSPSLALFVALVWCPVVSYFLGILAFQEPKPKSETRNRPEINTIRRLARLGRMKDADRDHDEYAD